VRTQRRQIARAAKMTGETPAAATGRDAALRAGVLRGRGGRRAFARFETLYAIV
jgi:hypothetical protein